MSPEEIARLPYRPCVGIMLIDRGGRVLVAQRINTPGEAWQMPQGGIDEGESPRRAALRELHEEVGTDKVEVLAESRNWWRYDLPAELVPRRWGGRYRGQEQKWFALRFLGTDADIDIATEAPEFRAWRWAEMAELPDIIVPFKRHIYQEVIAEFGHLAEAARQT
ncbi:MAG: RNA pyrophosphohydrolase [Alphaproteobacteria bacterium]